MRRRARPDPQYAGVVMFQGADNKQPTGDIVDQLRARIAQLEAGNGLSVQQAKEMGELRSENKTIDARIVELEAENQRLRAQLQELCIAGKDIVEFWEADEEGQVHIGLIDDLRSAIDAARGK